MTDNRAEGIDISAIGQGKFDWAAWEGHIDFGIVKATEGLDFQDPEFTRNWAAMAGMGIGRFAYHYGHPSEDPSKQALLFTDVLKANGYKDCGMFLDIEVSDGMSVVEVARWSLTFILEAQRFIGSRFRKRPGAYSDEAFIDAGNLATCGSHPLWIAAPWRAAPVMPAGPWADWLVWQYAWGTSGTGGPNRDKWNGTRADMLNYLRGK